MFPRRLLRHWKSSVIICACVVFIWYICFAQRFQSKQAAYLPTKDRHSNIALNHDIGVLHSSPNVSHSRDKQSHSSHIVSRSQKLILVWTTFFGNRNWIRKAHFFACANLNCIATEDKIRIAESDAVIMHERDLNGSGSLPTKRNSHQRWIWLTQETYMNFETNLSEFIGVFNWTMTHRLDSDIVLPYGTIRKRPAPLAQPALKAELARFTQNRTKLVAIRISHCDSPYTDRMGFVRKLQQYISVDILGDCGTPCSTSNNDCDSNFMRQYKFYLSFENSHCKDYITEKFWLPLNWWNNIPVVMGASSPADYEVIAPPHSYIHVDQFNSAESLAQYLNLLDKNQTLYDEYLQWRKTHQYYFSPYCDLCAALHNTSLPVKWYNDLADWYKRDKCSKQHPLYN